MIFNMITGGGGANYVLPVLDDAYPEDVTLMESDGSTATFMVRIAEPGEPAEYTYQWYVDGEEVAGAVGDTYTTPVMTTVGNKTVWCTVTNKAGTVSSRMAILAVMSAMPAYTYSGSHELIDDGNGDWRIKLKTSGILTFSNLGKGNGSIDVFLVGGGGGGGSGYGAGGGGGYTKTVGLVSISAGTEYEIEVGAGGTGGGSTGTAGGKTIAFSQEANGGGRGNKGGNGSTPSSGGAGGSGGGGSTDASSMSSGGNGGSDGSDGKSGYGSGGKGQGTSTREFYTLDQNTSATLYAGGGGGYWMSGGAGGGGGSEKSGTENTGGGGGGGNHNPGNGGSGIVVIRNHR